MTPGRIENRQTGQGNFACRTESTEAECKRSCAAAAELPQKDQAKSGEDDVGCPDAEEGTDLALPRQ